MLTTTLGLLAFTATLTSAQKNPVKVIDVAPAYGDPFGIEATGSGLGTAPVQITASQGRIYIGGPQDQPTNCSSAQTVHDFATFVWYSDKTLLLFSNDPKKPQQVWADAGADGLTGYSTAKQAVPAGNSLSSWNVDSKTRVVSFNGIGAKACPEDSQKTGKWGIWFSNAAKPGNLSGCFAVTLKAYKTPYRDACTYSHLASCEEEPQSCGPKPPAV